VHDERRDDVRASRAACVAGTGLAAIPLWLASCTSVTDFQRPGGDGGWSATWRAEELGTLARRAGVDFAAAPEPTPPASQPLDLATALAMAAKGNRRIAISENQLQGAAEEVRDVRGRLLPATLGSGRYTWYSSSERNAVSLPAGLAPPGGASIEIRPADFGTVNGTTTLSLDLSGELRHALAAAQAGYRGEQARVWATTLDQQLAVVRAYFQLLENERLREVTETNVALDREQLANAQAKFQSGRLTKNELLVVQVALQTDEEQLEQRALAIAQARYALNQAIGADVNAPTEPADVTERPAVPPVEQALRVAYADNPVLHSLVEEQQRLEETASSLVRSRFPRLFAGGAIDYSSSPIIEPQDIGSGFVGFSWDLGTDGRREAEIAEAKIAAERNRLEIERQLRELEALVRSTRQAAAERLAALAAAETAVGQAEENLRIRKQQFDAGRASSEDVLDAQALLAEQRQIRAAALYQAHVRLAELRSLMGQSAASESNPR
jgi:outer membrane protein